MMSDTLNSARDHSLLSTSLSRARDTDWRQRFNNLVSLTAIMPQSICYLQLAGEGNGEARLLHLLVKGCIQGAGVGTGMMDALTVGSSCIILSASLSAVLCCVVKL